MLTVELNYGNPFTESARIISGARLYVNEYIGFYNCASDGMALPIYSWFVTENGITYQITNKCVIEYLDNKCNAHYLNECDSLT